jgi:hypothetical protein
VLEDELGLIVSRERETEFVDVADDALEFDSICKEQRHGHVLLLNVPQERVLQRFGSHGELFQVLRKMLVHLEHGHPPLSEDCL